eukprot:scaffold499_cov335-Pavlova_lutheri.AAC.53
MNSGESPTLSKDLPGSEPNTLGETGSPPNQDWDRRDQLQEPGFIPLTDWETDPGSVGANLPPSGSNGGIPW